MSTVSRRFTKQLDFTSRAQLVHREARAEQAFATLETEVAEATPDSLGPQATAAFRQSGWQALMPVQARIIPHLSIGRDLVVQSRTGSGKTGAFLLPMFDLLDATRAATQALVLAPTRELAIQIHGEFKRLAPPGYRAALVYGGVGYRPQFASLRAGAHVVIGTPGRILDHLDRRTFDLQALRLFILDEADEMLSMGFYPAMTKLKAFLPEARQSCMFSATMPPKVRLLGREFLREPAFVGMSSDGVSVETIDHRCYRGIDPMARERALVRVIEYEHPDSAIVFCNMRREAAFVGTFLSNYGLPVDTITGDHNQARRERAMGRLRNGAIRLLVATDVAARGIDIPELSHVIQYSVSNEPESYIHRTGRTARAGKAGVAITLTTPDEESSLRSIAHRYNFEMERRELPTKQEAAARVAQRMIVILEERMRVKSKLERERLQRFVPVVEGLAREEPELVAMLVDELYQAHLNPAPREDTMSRRPPRGKRKR